MTLGRAPYGNPRDNVDEFGRNKLHYAANNGVLLSVKKLLDDGINIDAKDNNGWTSLHFASQNNHFKTIDLLLKYKADPNIYDEQGNGPLWIAAMHAKGKCDGVISLLKSHANPDHKNKHGRSPVYIANSFKNGLVEAFASYVNKKSK